MRIDKIFRRLECFILVNLLMYLDMVGGIVIKGYMLIFWILKEKFKVNLFYCKYMLIFYNFI